MKKLIFAIIMFLLVCSIPRLVNAVTNNFNGSMVPGDWEMDENWSEGVLPGVGDDVIFLSYIDDLGGDKTVNTFASHTTSTSEFGSAGATLTVTNGATFYDSSSNRGIITADTTFNGSSYNLTGTITGDTTFNGSSTNVMSTITGTTTFNDSSSTFGSSTLNGNVTLNTTGDIAGTINVSEGENVSAINSGTVSAAINGSGGLTKTGATTVTLSGSNTYSGETTISLGTLSVTGGITSSAVTINGGTLIGSGTVGNMTVADGGTFSPGLSPGTLNAGATTWESGGTYLWEINNATGLQGAPLGLGWDWLNITGGLGITATSGNKFNLNLSTMGVDAANFDNSDPYSWIIATASGEITDFSADKFTIDDSLFTNALGGGSFGIEQDGSNINLTFAAVPEPSTYALFGLGLFGLIYFRRRGLKS
ncbi:MAG: PEP-CTERM sorting domain-containing protein [Candidatus Ancaeobacter aquaticus]|nr:PEP-CTERM sorting domain-containing protein [Candidatus Ancaeobacter aquaticus]